MTDIELVELEVQAQGTTDAFPADVVLALVHEAQAREALLRFARASENTGGLRAAARAVLATEMGHEWEGVGGPEEHAIRALRRALAAIPANPGPCAYCGTRPATHMAMAGAKLERPACNECDRPRANYALAAPANRETAMERWYLADGSTVMLPAEEVERARRAAAVVLVAAEQAWIRRDSDTMFRLGRALTMYAVVAPQPASKPFPSGDDHGA